LYFSFALILKNKSYFFNMFLKIKGISLMIKLIATDMDGTFLDSSKRFSMEFFDIFEELRKKNIKFVIASGNQYFRLYQKFLPISNEMYFIGENGSYIAKGVKLIATNTLKKEQVQAVIQLVESHPELNMILCGVKSAYCLNEFKHLEPVVRTYYCNYQFVESYDDIDDEIMKIAIYDPNHQIIRYADDIACGLDKGVKATTSGNEWIDIQNEDINKGVAIKRLQRELNIKPEECMAFGDQMNDYTLLKSVKYSYAMANAVPRIKDIAYGIAKSNDHQGVLEVIKKEVLNQK